MLGGGSRPPQRLHHMLGGGWGVREARPPPWKRCPPAPAAQLGHLKRVVDAELSESARRDTFLERRRPSTCSAAKRAVAGTSPVRRRRTNVRDHGAAEPWSDSLTANPGQRLTVPEDAQANLAAKLVVNHAAASRPMPPRVLAAHVIKSQFLASHAAALAFLFVASA